MVVLKIKISKLIFGQFWAILLLGPSKSGRSLWVKKWITFFTMGVTAEEEQEQQQEEEESFVVDIKYLSTIVIQSVSKSDYIFSPKFIQTKHYTSKILTYISRYNARAGRRSNSIWNFLIQLQSSSVGQFPLATSHLVVYKSHICSNIPKIAT